ncbi:unnamed protein product, partial [Staurois parvus]
LHLAQYSQASTILLATIKPRHVHLIARQRGVISYSKEHVSTALGSCGGWLSCCCSQLLPLCFNTITIDRGIFSSKEISRMDLLHRWQPITLPCFNSLSS